MEFINKEALFEHTNVLASDEFTGRFPGTDGEDKTIQYISQTFQKLGIKPANRKENTYTQAVPLVEMKLLDNPVLSYENLDGSNGELILGNEVATYTLKSPSEAFSLDHAEMVFLGFGIDAPEFDWNDYEGLDVTNKIVVVLVSDPGVVFHENCQEITEKRQFKGKKMTYYGRWTYKFEEAARKGAKGVFVVHNEKYAGYPWSVAAIRYDSPYIIINEQFDPQNNIIQAWISESAVQKLTGKNYLQLAELVNSPGFKPFSIARNSSVSIKNSLRNFVSHNIVGLVESSHFNDASIDDENILIYSGHWDHFGKSAEGIYHGARDNALSVSACITIAQQFIHFKQSNQLNASILLFFATAEEQGLLGAEFYAQNPLFPLKNTLGILNMDLINVFHKTKDISFYGDISNSPFLPFIDSALKIQSRTLSEDPDPTNGMFYRSDHYRFSKHGVPALFINMGFTPFHSNLPSDILLVKNRLWTRFCYHKFADLPLVNDFLVTADSGEQISLVWDLEGGVEDVQLLYLIGQLYLQSKTNSDAK